MKKHDIKNANVLEKMQRERGIAQPISAVTIRRILGATSSTEPERQTLRRLAEFLREPYESAFPEPTIERAPSITVHGKRILLAPDDGRPLSPSLVDEVQHAIDAALSRKH